MKSKNMKKAIIFLGLSLGLSSCTNTYVKAIDLETANRLVNSALTEQNSFEVQSTSYSLRSEISEYVLDEFNQKKVFKQSSLEVDYMAPYLRSDEITKYRLAYSNETRYLFDGSLDTLKQVRVTEYVDTNDTSNRHFVVTENNVSHNYAATTDSAIASFINLPTLINSNNVTSLTLCQAYMGSIGKFNNLTSFEALSSGGDSFQITFEGESLSVNDLYAEETALPANISITSFSLLSNEKRVDYYESDYTYVGNIPELELTDAEIFGTIHVSYTYE